MGELDLWQRVIAAGGAGILSSLIVTPLDVVKVCHQPMIAKASTYFELKYLPERISSDACTISPAAFARAH